MSARLDRNRWDALLARQGLSDNGMFDRLATLHSERHRHYHTATHINAMLGHLDARRDTAARPDLIELAIWFHDAVYKPMSKTNEADSAEMARAYLAGHMEPDAVDWIDETIRLTANHGDTTDPDTALMLDIDLSILATAPDVYSDYTQRIRREYRWVPGPLYRKGRADVLRHFLAMPRIYKTDALADEWEAPARANLQAELENL